MSSDSGVGFLQALGIFALAAFGMAFGTLIFGWFFRPRRPNAEKSAAYECGETPIGTGWVQFDLRFYVVALVFLVFDVEIALFYPWAVVFGGGSVGDGSTPVAWEVLRPIRAAAVWDMLFFFGVIVVGFAYLWRFGYLDWVRSLTGQVEGTTPRDERSTRTAGTPLYKAS